MESQDLAAMREEVDPPGGVSDWTGQPKSPVPAVDALKDDDDAPGRLSIKVSTTWNEAEGWSGITVRFFDGDEPVAQARIYERDTGRRSLVFDAGPLTYEEGEGWVL